MLVFHPYLFIKFTVKKGLFVKNRANLKNVNKMKIGTNVSFGYDTRINFFNDSSDIALEIGDGSYFCNRVSILVGGKICIGKDVLVASDVCITSENHSINPMSQIPYMHQELKFKDVECGDGTWIGEKVVILPGVSIGSKCVIGAGSIVTKDIPDMSMAVGNPARVIKQYDTLKREWIRIESEYRK